MPVQIILSGDNTLALAAEVATLHAILSGPQPTIAVMPPTNTAPPAQPATEPAKKTRAKKEPAPPAAPQFRVFDETNYVIANFPTAKEAVTKIVELVSKMTDIEAIDRFAEKNEASLQQMTDDERKVADDAILAQQEALGARPELDSGDGLDETEVLDKVAVKAKLEAVLKTKGMEVASGILNKFIPKDAPKKIFGAVAEKDWPKLAAALDAEMGGKKGEASLFDE